MLSRTPPSSASGSDISSPADSGEESAGMDMNDSAEAPTQVYDLQHADFQLWRSKQESKRERKRQRTTAKAAAAAVGSAGSL